MSAPPGGDVLQGVDTLVKDGVADPKRLASAAGLAAISPTGSSRRPHASKLRSLALATLSLSLTGATTNFLFRTPTR
jgi:hypothetical protein